MAKSFLNMAGYPLGLRNNNPGNIRPFDQWQGMIGTNQGFAVFKDISWGLRAMAIALKHELNVGNNTVAKLIYEYAPPADGNDTEAYISSVINSSGFSRNQILTPTTDTLRRLMRSMMKVELGPSYAALLTDADINHGIGMMGSSTTDTTNEKSVVVPAVLFLTGIYLLSKA